MRLGSATPNLPPDRPDKIGSIGNPIANDHNDPPAPEGD
jgi:hypothetical protein